MNRGVFVTGTDTNVGKTFFSALFLKALRSRGTKALYWKALQTGTESDTDTVSALTKIDAATFPKPSFFSPHPQAPLRAARLEGRDISPEEILSDWEKIRSPDAFAIVEGAGGILVPITENFNMLHLAQRLELPVLVVASTKLGTINHTLLTVEALKASKLPLVGIVLNGNKDDGLAELLHTLSGVPVLAELPNSEEEGLSFGVMSSRLDPLLKKIFSEVKA